jgi:hypothetical protein
MLGFVVLALVVGLAPAAWAGSPRTSAPSPPAALVHAATARPGLPQIVLAQEHGLLLCGRLGALRGRSAPELESLTEAQADALGDLPSRNVYLRGADCAWGGRTGSFAAPLTLTFTLPKAIFRETPLPLYRFDGHTWKRLAARAMVGEVNTTASATITRPGRYALVLTADWKVVREDGDTLVEFAEETAPTVILDPQVTASGTTDDPAVISAVMDATGSTEEKAVGTLRSFDSSTGTPVQVITLTTGSAMVRYWSTSAVGRWLTPSGRDELLSPETARQVYALPADNTGENVTLHLVKRGAVLVIGLCADMTDQSSYGPWATGGGEQFFGPKLSTYPPPLYDPSMTIVLSDLRWEKTTVDAIVW